MGRWGSHKLKRVTRSTLASEILAISHICDLVLYIQELLEELTKVKIPITVYTDSKSDVDALSVTKVLAEKRLTREVTYLRNIVQEGKMQLRWIPTALQVADALTKRVVKHNIHKQILY